MTDNDSGMFENANEGLIVDLTNVEEMKFEVLPKGNYNAIIEDVEFQKSKSSDKAMWNVKLAVTDEDYRNRKLFTFLSFSEGALPGTKTNLAVIAPELTTKAFNPADPTVYQALIGVKVKIKVAIGKYNDQERNEVKRFLPTGEGGDGFITG